MVSGSDTIALLDLGGGDVGSSTKTICRLSDLNVKPLQMKHPETGLNSKIGIRHEEGYFEAERWVATPVANTVPLMNVGTTPTLR